VDCVSEGQKSIRPARTVGGARARTSGAKALVVVPALIAVNVLVFVATVIQAQGFDSLRSGLFLDGMLVPAVVANGEWWRLITSGFLHYGSYGGFGPVHLIFNMFALWVIGRDLEVALGRARFLAVYGLSLLGGSTAVMLFGDDFGSVAGASGAVYGLFGGIAVVVFRAKLNPAPVLTLLGINIFLSVALPGISLLGHLGGLVVGVAASAAMVYAPRKRLLQVQIGACVALVVVMIALIAIQLAGAEAQCEIVNQESFFCYRS
jgi:membrane associated rhomboid family serine protease